MDGAAHGQTLADTLVRLDTVSPGIKIIMDYAGPGNVTGRVLAGYGGRQCWLKREAAQALARVEHDLNQDGLGLAVHDCYRPVRAVQALIAWARHPTARTDSSFGPSHPRTARQALIHNGYIARRARHSLGLAVDLRLLERGKAGPMATTAGGDCRQDDIATPDMGTRFDCFDPLSQTRSGTVSAAARRNRARLVAAMAVHGFRNYPREWWHFDYLGPITPPAIALDLTIPP